MSGKRRMVKVPYMIRVRDQDYFAMAGLYDVWQGGDGSVLSTFTIVTTAAAKAMADLHDRMPVIVAQDMEAEWIAPGSSTLPWSTRSSGPIPVPCRSPPPLPR